MILLPVLLAVSLWKSGAPALLKTYLVVDGLMSVAVLIVMRRMQGSGPPQYQGLLQRITTLWYSFRSEWSLRCLGAAR